ncbi:MAG: peptide chain release factor N(5)-glutamine methyltransferase [Chitinispirillales bacterium]|jgi:release factor glutamine methyltransferase|nr:peptide chain release factor N(5)-glutamine methyltransferase [Chitinispirillales bacterium]
MTISELLIDIRKRLLQAFGDSTLADNEAVLIIEQSLGITKKRIYLDSSISIDTNDVDHIYTIVERRLRGEPLQYIFGKAYFYDREFSVNRDVLIPRPDTETLVDTVINTENKSPAMFIDIGTGSGILAAVLTAHHPDWTAVAIDISFKALQTASRNLFGDDDKSINNNIYLICGDILGAIRPGKRFDFIVSNPPYISSPQMKTLDRSVADYEPSIALYGGEDGLDYYRMISARAKMYLKDTGRIYLEIGFDQGVSVPNILRGDGWKDVAVVKDLAGRDRVAVATN